MFEPQTIILGDKPLRHVQHANDAKRTKFHDVPIYIGVSAGVVRSMKSRRWPARKAIKPKRSRKLIVFKEESNFWKSMRTMSGLAPLKKFR